MKKTSPKNYDFIWTVYNQTYLFNSIILHQEFLSRDFIVTTDHNTTTFYLSLKDRAELSHKGLIFLTRGFPKYRHFINKELVNSRQFIEKQKTIKIHLLNDEKLADNFMTIINFAKRLWQNYFWTEYFCLDQISWIVKNRPNTLLAQKLQKNIEQMGKLKYQQREILNDVFSPNSLMAKYYQAIALKLDLSFEKINNYSYQELIDLLNNKKIKAQNRTFVVKGKFCKWQDISGKPAQAIIRQLEKFNKHSQVIKGQTGNSGFYKGTVKIVDFDLNLERTYQQIKDMKKGQVLVSGSTGPEMILACKKAGAIVTDEGGITSHAAIVSRELKIPSVIATKYATKILKDGDLVEVDATRGIVKKILR
jgi:phosphohistidine swiveling domain-containing protein